MPHETISLLPAEQCLRQLLLDCRNDLLLSEYCTVQARSLVYGAVGSGNKLLGIPTSDIDAALGPMTGMQFGAAFQDFFAREGAKLQAGSAEARCSSRVQGAAQDCPEAGKVETSGDWDCSCLWVGCRSGQFERGDVHARQPKSANGVRHGTAEEDAFRPDATVNALFYNLDTQQVEDFTGKGL